MNITPLIPFIILLHVHQSLADLADIVRPFSLRVHNTSFPQIHGRQLNFWKAGGGDNHLFLAPAGNAVANNTLVAGVLTNREWWEGKSVTIRCVINGEYTPRDNTTKVFMTQRGDPRALFDAVDGPEPDHPSALLSPQTVLRLATLPPSNAGQLCVRPASGGRWELRFSGRGNTRDAGCVHVGLEVVY